MLRDVFSLRKKCTDKVLKNLVLLNFVLEKLTPYITSYGDYLLSSLPNYRGDKYRKEIETASSTLYN